ncbi:MAG: leucine-rich repeat domain-containing protein [Candidatus Hodarchaeota archaeon]
MPLTPKAIYEDLKNKDLDYNSALELLITLIDNTDNVDTRLESIRILEKIQAKDDKVYKLMENLLISDSNEYIRNLAASLIKTLFLDRALKPMKWALENETSLMCLITIISTLSDINNKKSKSFLIEKIDALTNQKYKFNLQNVFGRKNLERSSHKDLAELLINYYFISFLKIKFGYIKYEFNNLGYITKLDLTNTDPQGIFLSNFFDSILSLNQLKVLDLRFNHLIKLSEISNESDSITSLDLSYNKLIKLPESISKLKFLKILNLKSNRLRTLPDSLGALSLLQTLNLRNNLLNELPKSIPSLKKLKNLDLHGNKLTSIEFKLNQSINDLDLGWNNFYEIPTSIKSLVFLEKLGMSGNKIKKLPNWISSFQSLISLYLYDNNITELPNSIGKLKSLENLILRNNQLSSLPESFQNLKNLKELNLSWNNFSVLPEWIGDLSALEELNLWGNQLEQLTESIALLPSLKILDLNFNKIKTIPESLRRLERNRGLIIKI